MFTTISSGSSSSRSGGGTTNSCSRNSSMPSLRMRSPLSAKTSFNPLYRHSDITSFDASNFIFSENNRRREKRALRRYNSHDSTHLVDAISSSENTPESTRSRRSPHMAADPDPVGKDFAARDFLERYSLPRVVRVDDGEPLLLYRCFDSFTKIEAKAVLSKRGKERVVDGKVLHFPEGYNGWFSLINDKGERSAVAHSTVLQLVREQVCSFISIQPFIAYAGHHSDPTDAPANNAKLQYLKTQVKGGQLFQLRAVFQHRDPDGGRTSTKSARVAGMGRSTRDKDLANRYAQLISQTNQEFYVPLNTKGEFYEIHSSVKAKLCFPGMLDKTGPLALDKDCLYKLAHLLRRVALPIKVKLMVGSMPRGASKDFTDTFILERKYQEPLLVTCTLTPSGESARHEKHTIGSINLNSTVRISRCMLGFDSENRLFKSQRLQSALSFCHANVESWYRDVRLAPNIHPPPEIIQPAHQSDEEAPEKQLITKDVLEKFPKAKKWYKHFRLPHLSTDHAAETEEETIRSTERYKDMSKLIEEKFGRKNGNPVKKSASFMFSTRRMDLSESKTQDVGHNPALSKCQSLDTQLFAIDQAQTTSKSSISDSLSYDFQMCILDTDQHQQQQGESYKNDNDTQDVNAIQVDKMRPRRKNKPDLIPTLTKADNSFITDRLCSEFHVKTKMQKRTVSKHSLLAQNFEKTRSNAIDVHIDKSPHLKSVIVQIHEQQAAKVRSKLIEEDIPYCQVADEISLKPNGLANAKTSENVYTEICDRNKCTCASNSMCKCANKKRAHSDYCYVKLGSNGDSVTSDSDEAIYNTLR